MHWLHTVHHDGSEKYRSTLGDGGDLSGIVQPLDHLERLGVSAICLNPVLAAYSSYRYDPIDYTHVDPHLGSDEALITLRRVRSRLRSQTGRALSSVGAARTRNKFTGGNTIT
jgi:glycosidase